MDGATTAIVSAAFAGLNIVFTIGGGFYFMGRVTGRMDAHEANTVRLEAAIHGMSALLVTSAVEADRLRRAEADIERAKADIDNLEDDFRKLRQGKGWINDDEARGVNREYGSR